LLYDYPLQWVLLPTKSHNRALFFGSTILKHGRQFDYWNQPLNISMRIWYLDCHEAGLCCDVVIQVESLSRPLLLFYFHLWPIYWLSLVCNVCMYVYVFVCVSVTALLYSTDIFRFIILWRAAESRNMEIRIYGHR
jgi:hypothetical protein